MSPPATQPPLPLEQWRLWWKRRGGRELRQILYLRWDPYGIAGAALPWNDDEYDDYAGPVSRLLREGAGPEDIADYLHAIEGDGIGLEPASPEQLSEIADLIYDWYGQSLGRWIEES